MIRLMAGLSMLLIAAGSVLAQDGPNTRVYTNDNNSGKPRQRYVCVVPQPDSAQSQYPNVCRADAGRVGGRCRCSGVTGNGTLQLGR
jgi:hypothetical protein